MSFTYTSFINNISSLVVSGVTKRYSAPVSQVTTAVLPCSYPRIPSIENSIVTLTNVRDLRKCVLELVVIVEPLGQSSNITNFGTAIALLDSLETSFVTSASDYGIDSWSIGLDVENYGNIPYWVLIARVQGSGT